MPEIYRDPNIIDIDFQLCKYQGMGTDCNYTGVGKNYPSGVRIRQLTKTRECTKDCNSRKNCSRFKEK